MDLTKTEAGIAEMSIAHRRLVPPLLRALWELGRSAAKKEVVAKTRKLMAGELTKKQLDYLEAKDRYGWSVGTLRRTRKRRSPWKNQPTFCRFEKAMVKKSVLLQTLAKDAGLPAWF